MQNKTLSQLEIDGVPSFYIGMYGVCTHRMGLLDIPVWCKNPEAAINFINNHSQQKPKPKRWTVEDQKAGRLPEVGSVFTHRNETLTCLFIDADGEIWAHDINNRIVTPSLCNCYPIETPAEKAQREEDEWVNKAWSETAVFAGVAQDEHDRLRIHLRHIYKAQLSGELQAPKGGE